MSLSQLHKKQLEEFEKTKQDLKDWQYGTVYKLYDREEECEVLADDVERYFPKSYPTKSILSTLQGVLEMLEEGKYKVYEHTEQQFIKGYNESITDTQKKIEEEIIKIKEMKLMDIKSCNN